MRTFSDVYYPMLSQVYTINLQQSSSIYRVPEDQAATQKMLTLSNWILFFISLQAFTLIVAMLFYYLVVEPPDQSGNASEETVSIGGSILITLRRTLMALSLNFVPPFTHMCYSPSYLKKIKKCLENVQNRLCPRMDAPYWVLQ